MKELAQELARVKEGTYLHGQLPLRASRLPELDGLDVVDGERVVVETPRVQARSFRRSDRGGAPSSDGAPRRLVREAELADERGRVLALVLDPAVVGEEDAHAIQLRILEGYRHGRGEAGTRGYLT